MIKPLRRALVIDLDAGASIETLCALWSAGETAAEVRLCCARLMGHEVILRELADRRAARALRAHHVVIRTFDVRCDDRLRESLVRLGTAIEIDGIEWPAPRGRIRGLDELVRTLIAVHVVMVPGPTTFDDSARQRCIGWCRSEFVSGLCLRLDPAAIAADRFPDLLNVVRSLELELGDVVIADMPGDKVLLGNTDRGWASEPTSEAACLFRLAYLRWRIPLIKALETDCPWSQAPEVKEKLVRSADNLLSNRPELLRLGPGSSVVDVCGGTGRVARRLAAAVRPGEPLFRLKCGGF